MSETIPLDPHAPRVFTTGNLALAIALAACGCPFPQEGGKVIAGVNKYSLGFIRAQTDPKTGASRCSGMPMEKAIALLWRLGIPGNVEYSFEASPELTKVCAGWDEQGESKGGTATPVDEQDFGRIARALARAREDFIGSKATVPIWRRRDADGNLFVPAVKHIEGTAHTDPGTQRRSTTTIRGGSLHAVEV